MQSYGRNNQTGVSLRVNVLAETLDEAKGRLEAEYGEGNVYDLHNE